MRETGDRAYAFKTTVADLAVPLFAASGTTALGMLSLATSDVHAVRAFGIGSAVGVMVDFVISLVFVPTLLTFVKGDAAPPPQERWLLEPMRRVALFSTRRSRLVMGVAAMVAVLSIAGILKLRVDTNHINFFSDGHPLHESADLIDRDLSGVYSFQVFFEGPPDSMRDPAILARMDRLQQEILALPNVRKAVSLVDYVKRVNRELNDGRKDAEIVPASADLIAQELLVLGLSDDGRRELEHVAASDYSRAQMTVRLASMSSDIVFAQINEARDAREARVRRQRGEADGDGLGPVVRAARSLSGDVAVEQLRDRVRHGVRRDLRHLPIVQVRAAGDRAEPLSGARDSRRDGVARHLAERRDRDARQRRARRGGRRHDPFHQPLSPRGGGGRRTRTAASWRRRCTRGERRLRRR